MPSPTHKSQQQSRWRSLSKQQEGASLTNQRRGGANATARATSPSIMTPLSKKAYASSSSSPVLTPSTVASTPSPRSSTLSPSSALFEHRQEQSSFADDDDSPIPERYIICIQIAFGEHVDLYQDVFKVERNASEKELRIAFFRRGREVLSQQSSDSKIPASSSASAAELSKAAKKRFQAVSMAYEILTTPELKTYYDANGFSVPELAKQPKLTHPESDWEVSLALSGMSNGSSSPLRSNKSPILRRVHRGQSARPRRRSRSTPRSSSSTGGNASNTASGTGGKGIRWSEEVEELLYKQDPEEVKARTTRRSSDSALGIMFGDPPKQSKASHRKVKKKIILEAQELTQHLEHLDQEANTSSGFVGNFLDGIETSLDGFEASVEEFVRFAMASDTDKRDASEGDPIRSKSPAAKDVGGAVVEVDDDASSVRSDAPPLDVSRDEDATIATNEVETDDRAPVATVETKPVHGKIRGKRVRERVMVLLNGSSNGSPPDGSAAPRTQDGGADAAESLFADLTKPPPSVVHREDESNGDDLVAKQLFADLTKPVPKGLIAESQQSMMPMAKKDSEERKQGERPQGKPPLGAKTLSRGAAGKLRSDEQGFDPFAPDSVVSNMDGITFAHSLPDVPSSPPPNWIVDPTKGGGTQTDEAFSVSTMSFSETTDQIRERMLLRASASRASEVAVSPATDQSPERCTSNGGVNDSGVAAVIHTDDDGASPTDVVQGLNDSFEAILASFGDGEDMLKINRAQSAVSSISGLASSFAPPEEQGLRRFCPVGVVPDDEAAAEEQKADPTADPAGENSGVQCNQQCAHEGDEDFMTRFSSYMKSFGEEISKFSASFATMVESSVTVPEDDVQSMLDVLSRSDTGTASLSPTVQSPQTKSTYTY